MALALGADVTLTKPLDQEKLLAAVARVGTEGGESGEGLQSPYSLEKERSAMLEKRLAEQGQDFTEAKRALAEIQAQRESGAKRAKEEWYDELKDFRGHAAVIHERLRSTFKSQPEATTWPFSVYLDWFRWPELVTSEDEFFEWYAPNQVLLTVAGQVYDPDRPLDHEFDNQRRAAIEILEKWVRRLDGCEDTFMDFLWLDFWTGHEPTMKALWALDYAQKQRNENEQLARHETISAIREAVEDHISRGLRSGG